MKKSLISSVLIFALSGFLCVAQTNQPPIKEDFKPSTKNQPGQQYPMVNSQGYARFRVVAPQAQSVVVSLGLGGTKLVLLSQKLMTAHGWYNSRTT